MAAVLTQIADAVVTLLSSTVTTLGGTVARSFDPEYALEDLTALRVTVVPLSEARTRTGRKVFTLDHTVEVGVQRKLGDLVTEETVLEALETLAAKLEDNNLTSPAASLVRLEVAATYDRGHLDEKNLFTGVLMAVYRTQRAGT